MKTKDILSIAAFILGETIIITSFLLWGNDVPAKQNITNIIITSVIYCLIFIDVFKPWININEPSHKSAGSIGLRWIVTGIYSLLAITTIICSYAFELTFSLQIIIHLSLLALLILGFSAVFHSSDKVESVYKEEKEARQPIKEMKAAFDHTKEALENVNTLNPYKTRLDAIEENLRYLSPCNNQEARILEKHFFDMINKTNTIISSNPTDQEKIMAHLNKIEQIIKKRKSIYSI